MAAVHLVVKRNFAGNSRAIKTACGRVGFVERNTNDEYSTVNGDRFEAVETARGVTCKRCASKPEGNAG